MLSIPLWGVFLIFCFWNSENLPLANETAFSGSIPWTRNGFRYFLKRTQFILSGYSQLSKILSLKFQFDSAQGFTKYLFERSSSPKYSISDCLETFPRIRSFWIIRSSSDISGVFGRKESLREHRSGFRGEGGKGAALPFFPCIFEKRKLTNERDYSFGPSSEFSGSAPGTRFSRKPQKPYSWLVLRTEFPLTLW